MTITAVALLKVRYARSQFDVTPDGFCISGYGKSDHTEALHPMLITNRSQLERAVLHLIDTLEHETVKDPGYLLSATRTRGIRITDTADFEGLAVMVMADGVWRNPLDKDVQAMINAMQEAA